jgi:hypothetical protein
VEFFARAGWARNTWAIIARWPLWLGIYERFCKWPFVINRD